MAATAFVVRVPEAEAHVRDLRERFDPSVRLGVPAHITVLFPFMAPEYVVEDVRSRIAQVFADVQVFSFSSCGAWVSCGNSLSCAGTCSFVLSRTDECPRREIR